MTKPTDNFEELHAPEVVKPLSSIPEHLNREKSTDSGRDDTSHKTPPSVEDKHRKEEIGRVPKPEKKERSPAMVIFIVLGISIVIWYVGFWYVDSSKETPRRMVPTASSVKTVQSSIPKLTTESTAAKMPASPLPRPLGGFQLSAYAIAADSQRHSVAGIAAFVLKQVGTNFGISTNVEIPCVWRNIPAGEHRLSFTVVGYHPSATNGLMIIAEKTSDVAVVLQPLPAKVRFVFPTNNVKFSVYAASRYLGNSNDYYDLEPFISHNLTFKARGWRDQQMTVTLAKPGTKYRCPVKMEKIEARLQVTVVCLRGKTPISGFLSFDGESPFEAKFPLSGKINISEPLTLALSVEGYHVLNNTQCVVFVDRQVTNVEFTVEPYKE